MHVKNYLFHLLQMERWAEPAAETAAQPSLGGDVREAASEARLYGLKFWSQPTAARVGRRNEQHTTFFLCTKFDTIRPTM